MSLSVFDFSSYKKYILQWIEVRPQGGRGERLKISETLGCQPSYVSQVLSGSANISFEQAESLNAMLGHSEDEAQFFLLLVHMERAGTAALKNRIQKRIQGILNQRLVLKNRLDYETGISREDQASYYSAWYYAAIHIALAIPLLQTREALVRAFRLPTERVSQVLEFLLSRGLATESHGRFRPGSRSIHLESDSPMISKHHTNWRMQSIQALEKEEPSELHYSSVVTIAEADIPKVREALVKAIEQVRAVVKPSNDETLLCYTLDLFRLSG